MLKIRLKGCPRCGGDLMPDRSDASEKTYGCLQCGRDFQASEIRASAVGQRAARIQIPAAA